jgi:putative peptide zinc metalloprotease protein
MDRAVAELIEARPQRAAHCTLEQQDSRGDTPVYILKDAACSRYMMLSEEGLFLWQLIDGERTIASLCQSYAARYRGRGPREAIDAIGRLYASKLINFERLNFCERHSKTSAAQAASAWCSRYCWLEDIDRAVGTLYRWLRPLFAPLAQGALLLVACAGLVAFGRHLADGAWPAASVPSSLLSLLLQVVVHEAAHALTCKHFGRRVRRAGIGWHYFAPVAFVDTSDIWATSRLQRVLVSAAGPYANLVLSGVAGLCAFMCPAGEVSGALWSLSAVGYVLALVNLNPLIELDGYYIAMDLLDLPNLRARAFACLGAVFRRSPRADDAPRLRPILLAFGIASLAYGVAMAAGILLLSRAWIASLAGIALPPLWVQAMSLVLTGAMSMLVLRRLRDELMGATGARRRRG